MALEDKVGEVEALEKEKKWWLKSGTIATMAGFGATAFGAAVAGLPILSALNRIAKDVPYSTSIAFELFPIALGGAVVGYGLYLIGLGVNAHHKADELLYKIQAIEEQQQKPELPKRRYEG